MNIGRCPSAAVCAGVAACAGFVTAVRGERSAGKPPCGIWELQFLRTCVKEQVRKVGMQTQKPDVLWHSARCSSRLWLTWPGRAVLGSACPEVIQHSLQQRHREKLPLCSQELEWEPNQLPKSCLGCLTRVC